MNRTIRNLLLWLCVLALLGVLYFGILHPHKWQRIQAYLGGGKNVAATQAPASANRTDDKDINGLLQQKRELTQQQTELQKEIRQMTQGPSSVFIVFTTGNEAVIREAAQILDGIACPGFLGVTPDMLAEWSMSGVPAFVNERIAKGWEICLIPENVSPVLMQEQLQQMGLPRAAMAYRTEDTPVDPQSGVCIILEEVVQQPLDENGVWHVVAMGNMNGGALYAYENKLNAGSAIAFLIGDYQADQYYLRDNLLALADLIRRDSTSRLIQCIPARDAYAKFSEKETELAPLREEWNKRETMLEEQIKEINRQIYTS